MEQALPSEFMTSIRSLLPDTQWDTFVQAMNAEPAVSLRKHPVKGKGLFLEQSRVLWCETGVYLEKRPNFALDPAFHNGSYYVQEAASMFLEHVFKALELPDRARILDLCAAPGGKSTHLLSLLLGNGLLVSNEVVRSRFKILNENITKWGYPNVVTTNNDPERFGRFPAVFDAIFVDAPCSGEGMFRKDEKARMEWSENNVQHCHMRQRRILKDVWPALKAGGYLIYSTCTFNELEDEGSLQDLINQGKAESLQLDVPWQGIDCRELKGIYSYRFWPHQVKSEGFFISVLRKLEKEKPLKMNESVRAFSPAALDESILMPTDAIGTFRTHQGKYFAFPTSGIDLGNHLLNNFRVGLLGTELAQEKGKDLRWSHDFAMSIIINPRAFDTLPLSEEEALNYLRRRSPEKGQGNSNWVLVTYRDQPLGWLKKAGTRWNNCYPQDWRLRLQ